MTATELGARPPISEISKSASVTYRVELPDQFVEVLDFEQVPEIPSELLIGSLVDIHSGPERTLTEKNSLYTALSWLDQKVVHPRSGLFSKVIILHTKDETLEAREERDVASGKHAKLTIIDDEGDVIDSVVATQPSISLGFNRHTEHHITGDIDPESGIRRASDNQPRKHAIICASPHGQEDGELPEIITTGNYDLTLILTTVAAEDQLTELTENDQNTAIGIHPTIYVQATNSAIDLVAQE